MSPLLLSSLLSGRCGVAHRHWTVDVLIGDHVPKAMCVGDEAASSLRWHGLTTQLVVGDVTLGTAHALRKSRLGDTKAFPDEFDVIHRSN